jgi:sugar phosphate isomerase/epimerase
MRYCCGSSFSTNQYAKFEAGSFRRVPTSDDIVENIRWASSVEFEAVEFAILTRHQLDSTFDRVGIEKIVNASKTYDIEVPHVSFPFLSGLYPSSESWAELRQLFSVCARITFDLGADLVQLHSPPVPGTEATWDVAYPGGPARKISFHKSDEWKKIWETYVRWIGESCDDCKEMGLKLAIEARPREIIGNTDAMLNLLKDVSASNLGVIFDTGHHFTMREILPISIWKLGSALYSVQLSDNDGIIEYQWAPGEGNIEWKPLVEALKSVEYGGYLVIEASGLGRQSMDFVKARDMIRSLVESNPVIPSKISKLRRNLETNDK